MLPQRNNKDIFLVFSHMWCSLKTKYLFFFDIFWKGIQLPYRWHEVLRKDIFFKKRKGFVDKKVGGSFLGLVVKIAQKPNNFTFYTRTLIDRFAVNTHGRDKDREPNERLHGGHNPKKCFSCHWYQGFCSVGFQRHEGLQLQAYLK